VPARLDRLPWSRWHWLVLIGLGTVWILDGLEVTIVGAVGSTLTSAHSGISITTAQIGDAASVYIAGACVGALFFGHLTDRLGRKRLFLVTLGVYLLATVLTATSRNAAMFFVFRFFTGTGIGGEYAAINSAIDELIPARVRGTVDLVVNGSYWLGTAAGAAATLILLNPRIVAVDLGWRVCFFMGGILGLAILLVRRNLPESPRWLFTHGCPDAAEEVVDDIERQVRDSTGEELEEPGDPIEVRPRGAIGILTVAKVVFGTYPRRSVLGLSLFIGQAFLYNAVFFTYSLVLTTFYKVANGSVGYYLIAFAVGNFLGPLILGRLFDVVGRRAMIAGTYLLSGAMLAVTAYLFDAGVLSATTQTIAWVVIFFFASAGASPMETRALAIAFFYAVGTGLGGIVGPALFGNLISTKHLFPVSIGYLIGGCLMFAAGIVEIVMGLDAERQPLEAIATPLSAADGHRDAPPDSLVRQTGPAPVARHRTGRVGWAPLPQASRYPRTNPYLGSEVDRIVDVLQTQGPTTAVELSRAVRANRWGPGRFRAAVRSGLASGRIRRVGRGRFAAAGWPDGTGPGRPHPESGL
jgi:MFS family permease